MTLRTDNRAVAALAAVAAFGLGQAARAGDGDKGAGDDISAADRARLEQAFGSTIVSTYPDGRQAELWLKRDGTYTSEGRRHDHTNGVWQVKGQKLCLRQRAPFPAPFSFCTKVPSGGLDQPWQAKAFTGETVTVRLVRGIHPGGTVPDEGRQQQRAQGGQGGQG